MFQNICILFLSLLLTSCHKKELLFFDDFENGLSKWELVTSHKVKIIKSKDPVHQHVMALYPHGPAVYALIKNSDKWNNYCIEGDFLFPINHHHYLGFIYNYNETGNRVDFGSIFVFGPYSGVDFNDWSKIYNQYNVNRVPEYEPGNIIMVNPHRDGNASRLLYNEYVNKIPSDSAVLVNEWHKFKAEVINEKCHFYVDNMSIPKMIFNYFEFGNGKAGFKPRFAGSEVWIDNIKAKAIPKFSYEGIDIPSNLLYNPQKLIRNWSYLGPFYHRHDEAALEYDKYGIYHDNGTDYNWTTFNTDARGCVITGKITRKSLGQNLVYFHSKVNIKEEKKAILKFSTSNNLILWVNNENKGYIKSMNQIWYDFYENKDHEGIKCEIELKKGENHIVVLAIGGRYGGDGFYASLDTSSIK